MNSSNMIAPAFIRGCLRKLERGINKSCIVRWPRWIHTLIWVGLITIVFLVQNDVVPDRSMTSFYVLPLLYGVLFLPYWADMFLTAWMWGSILRNYLGNFNISSILVLISVPLVLGVTSLIGRILLYMFQRERALLKERERLNEQLVYAFAKTIEYKDEYTMGHSIRVAEYAREIAKQLKLPTSFIERIYITGLLHDVGKIGVREAVLQKPGLLFTEERQQIQTHVELGVRILQGIVGFEDVAQMVADHHERWDGFGYPQRKKGVGIGLGGRILAVADAYDAMTTKRVYREPVGKKEACAELDRCSGSQFDPVVVEAFLRVLGEQVLEKTMYA